jgi:uncharacterized protein YjbI with pentapeptide repeats
MFREPRRKTVHEVLAACQRGKRDFRGADLAGLDLSGADLRGADFRGANLRAARLRGCRLGPTLRWRVMQQIIGVLLGVVAWGLMAVASLLFTASLCITDTPSAYRVVIFTFVPGLLGVLTRRGFNFDAFAVAVAGAAAVTGAGAVAFASAGASADAFAGAFTDAIAIAGAIAGAFAFTLAVAGAFAVAFALAFALAVAGAAAFAFNSPFDFAFDKVAAAAVFVTTTVTLTSFSFYLRRRALAGAPHDAWLRVIALWLPGLGGARFAGADLTDADLSQIHARGADLRQARLIRTTFRDARELHLARFDGPMNSVALQRLASGLSTHLVDLAGQDLTGLAIDGADFRGAKLRAAILKEARLVGANLDQACLEHADLCAADLRGVRLQTVALRGARVDIHTYLRSEWAPDDLAWMLDQGVEVLGLNGFPEPVQARLVGEKEGLTLYFSTRLSTFDKVLVDGVIVGVLGRETTCHAEYRVHGQAAIVRLFDAPRDDLERVAEALHLKVWEQTQLEQSALVRLPETLPHAALREGLSSLMGRRLERMELREAPPEPGPALLRWRWESPTEPGANRLLGPRPCRLFLLHAPDDHELAAELREHLQSLVRQQLVDHFSAEELLGGDDADVLLSAHLESADAIVVLVSKSLLQEGPWYQQLTRAMARHHAKSARVIPVLVRPVACEGEAFTRLQALPENAPPVVSWPDRDAAWACVVSGLRRALLNQAGGTHSSRPLAAQPLLAS